MLDEAQFINSGSLFVFPANPAYGRNRGLLRMPLKRSYATEAEVPTERKADYVLKDGRYVLDVEGFDNIDSVLAKNSELLGKVSGHATELSGRDTEISRLKSDLANANVVPRGYKSVLAADAELVEAVKAAGVTDAASFNTLKTEHGNYKTKAETADRRARFADVGKKLKWNDDAPDVLEVVPSLPEIEDRDVTANGKTEKVPHVKLVAKNAAGQEEVSYRPFGEWFAEKHPALLRSVTAKAGPVIATQGVGDPPDSGDILEKRLSAQRAAQAANPNPLMPKAPAATATA